MPWISNATASSTTTPGGWIDARPTYITIGEDGVRIHEYAEPVEEPEEQHEADLEVGDDFGAGYSEEEQVLGPRC